MPDRHQSRVLQKKAEQHTARPAARRHTPTLADPLHDMLALQHTVGNQALTSALRQEAEGRESSMPPVVRSVLSSAGQPIDAATRASMEARFARDFSQVRLHTDGQAAASAHALKAQAYTVGQDIVFGRGRYAPETEAGQRLLAHELTHVVQQSYGAGLPPSAISETRTEREAEHVSQAVFHGQQPVSVAQQSGQGVARRIAEPEPENPDSLWWWSIWHPRIASEIGEEKHDSLNISTNATRFAAGLHLHENPENEGSQVNALRHAIWQATITVKFGADTARAVGWGHEKNPRALNKVQDPTALSFAGERNKAGKLHSTKADEAVDLLNNIIGRQIGSNNPGLGMRDLAWKALAEFHNNGLWTYKEQSDGTFKIEKTRITNQEFQAAASKLMTLDAEGFEPQERVARDKREQAREEEQKVMRWR